MDDAELREHALRLLPEPGRDLLAEIEAHSGRLIQFRHEPADRPEGDLDPLGPEGQVTATEALIRVPDPLSLSAEGVAHELLHIWRYWVAPVPQLYPAQVSPDRLRVLASIENALEHQVIVPMQAQLGLSDAGHWNSDAAKTWAAYPWPRLADEWVRRKNALLLRLSLQHVTDADVIARARDALGREGLLGEGDKFAARIAGLVGSKEQMASCALRFTKIARADVRLVYFHPRAGTLEFREVPAN